MEKYIAFLRGINISGKNKISMSELKDLFGELGFTGTQTYLNSGNVVFDSENNDTGGMRRQIEEKINDSFLLDIPVFSRL